MKQRRDIIILVVLFIILVLFTVFGPGQSDEDTFSSKPTTHSSAPKGTLAFYQWTQKMGFNAQRLEYRPFEIDDDTATLVLLNPMESVTLGQTEDLLTWINDGGTLILVESRPAFLSSNNTILDELEIAVVGLEERIHRAPVVQPILSQPPIHDIVAETGYGLQFTRQDVAHLVGMPPQEATENVEAETEAEETEAEQASDDDDSHRAIIASMKHGKGYIFISSALFPFTNEGLREEENAALLLNLLRNVPQGGKVVFDEWHHGFHTPPSMRSEILGSPWGQALVYALAVFALYVASTGRRFGRPIPLKEDIALRSSTEYVESMADLFQRGKKHDYILRHYRQKFKRTIARPYGINPQQDDSSFLREIARYNEDDTEQIQALLVRLNRQNISDEALLRLIEDINKSSYAQRMKGTR